MKKIAQIHNDHGFAMLHASSAIEHTPWEGMYYPHAVTYMQNLLALEERPVALGLNSEQLVIAQHVLTDLSMFTQCFQQFEYSAFLKLLHERADTKKGIAYLPAGWLGNQAHFTILKAQRVKGNIFLMPYLNAGSGAEYHRPIAKGEDKTKRSYDSEPKLMDFDTEFGRAFIENIVQLNFDTRIFSENIITLNNRKKLPTAAATIKPFGKEDLYGLLAIFGEPYNESMVDLRTAANSQRVGSCTITNTKAAIIDALLYVAEMLPDKIKRFIFALKLTSLNVAHAALQQDLCDAKLLAWSLREASVRITKLYPEIISADEALSANQLIQAINQDFEQRQQAKCITANYTEPFPPLCFQFKQQHWQLQQDTETDRPSFAFHSRIAQRRCHRFIATTAPAAINKNLMNAVDKLAENRAKDRPIEILRFLSTLPKTSGMHTDEFWDQVPTNDLTAIIESLCTLCKMVANIDADNNMLLFEAALIAYDIAGQLAPRISELHLGNDYALAISDFAREGITIQEAETYYSVKQIIANFQQRCHGKSAIFTNDISHKTEDKTCRYITDRLLNKERRAHAVSLLKELRILEQQHTDAPDNLLINILLIGAYRPYFGWAINDPISVDVTSIINKTYWNIIQLTTYVHNLGKLPNKDQQKIGYQSFENNKLEEDVNLQIINGTHFQFEIKLTKELTYHFQSLDTKTDFAFRGLINRDVNGIPLNYLPLSQEHNINKYVDFAENTLYLPRDQLRNLISISDYYSQNPSSHSIGIERIAPFQYRYSGSFSLNNPSWSITTINQALESLDEDLRRIEVAGSLRIPLLFEWLQTNFDKLNYPEARTRLSTLFFELNYLDYALIWHPQEVCELAVICFRAGFQQAIAYLTTSDELVHGEVFVWLCSLQYYFWEYAAHAAKLYDFSLRNYQTISIRQALIAEIQCNKRLELHERYAKLLLLTFKDQSPDKEDYQYYIAAKWLMALKDTSNEYQSTISDLDFACATVWDDQFEKLCEYFKSLDQTQLDALIQNALQFCQLDIKNSNWQYFYETIVPNNRNCSVNIDLSSGKIAINQHQIQDRTSQFKQHPILKTLRIDVAKVTFHEKPAEIESGYQAIFSSDGIWQFEHNNYNNKITAIYKRVILNGVKYWFKVQSEVITAYFSAKKRINPFESTQATGAEYLYATQDGHDDVLMVEPINGDNTAYLYQPQSGWACLQQQNGTWTFAKSLFLDLINPQTDVEMAWSKWLKNSLGCYSLHPIAKLHTDVSFELESLTWRKFNLSFCNEQGELSCQQHPGYIWNPQNHHVTLASIPTLISLADKKGNNKYLLPPFLFLDKRPTQIGSSTNEALSHELFIDTQHILDHPDCFEYYLDRHEELCGQSIEADLYLALIYRCLGDYRRAMQALERTACSSNNTELQVQILALTEYWPDHSALGAAFDCQILLRLYHHHAKWSQQADQWIKAGVAEVTLLEYCLKQYTVYKKHISTRKQDVSIIPEYLRVTQADKQELQALKKYWQDIHANQATNKATPPDNETYHNGYVKVVNFTVELKQMKTYFETETSNRIRYYFSDKMFNDKRHHRQDASYPLSLRVIYQHSDSLENYYQMETSSVSTPKKPDDDEAKSWQDRKFGPADCPGYDHLLQYFVNMFEDAIADDRQREKRVKAKIFLIARNDTLEKTGPFLALLSIVLQNKNHFKSLQGKHYLTRDCVWAIADAAFGYHYKRASLNTSPIMTFFCEEVQLIPIAAAKPTLPKAKPAAFSFDNVPFKASSAAPLQELLTQTFSCEDHPILTTDFLDTLDDATSLIEQRLNDRLKQGNTENKNLCKVVFCRTESMLSLLKLTASLKQYKSQYQAELASKKQLLLTAANDCPKGTNPENVSYCHAARRGEQTLAITLKEIVDALLWQNFSTLQQRNPFLTSEHCHQLMGLMIEYAVLQSAADQVDAALMLINNREQFAAMEPYELQLLGRILSAKRQYSIQEYPEFLIYEYATKRIIRPDQSAALIQLISLIETNNINTNEFKHCLKQFAAGGGKSAVMIIILVARFVRRGFLPTIFNTNELYAIGVHEIAKNLRLAYNIDLEVIERELNFQWSSADLQRLTADLHIWHQGKEGKKALLVKPVTWHGIHIAQMLGSLNDDTDLLNEADKVLDFLFEYTIKLEDEGHIISDPLQSNITTRGELLGVGIQYQRLLLEIYSHLLGVQPQSRDLAELAGIIHKNKELLHDHELRRLQEQLSDRMIDFQAYKKIDATQLRQFFLQETRTKPDWLKTLRQQQCELASLVVLGRAFIKSLLPHLLSLQYNNHFGTSIHAGDLTPAPMQDGKHLYSHFADLMLVTALAIQLYDITGIPQHLLEEMITQYHQNHKKQRQSTQAAVTNAEQEFNRLLPKNVAYVHFEAFSTATKQMLVNDFSIRHSYQFISEFLLQKVFPQITTPAMRIESTAADFQAGFQRSIIFTATPGLLETYPATLTVDHFYEMLSFEAEVVATLLKPENSQHCQFPMTHDPAVLFNSMYKQFPELFKKMTTLIDRGALVADIDPAAVTKIIFELFDERDARKSALFFEEGKMCFFSKSSTLNNTSYPGSDLLSVLKRHNIDAKQMLVFLFLDISKTTGTDVSRPQQDCAGLTIGKGQTLSSTIQAAMRERLLLEQNAQTVIWLIFIELYQKISPKSALFDLRIILKWMVKNDAEALTYKCINRAYQGINQAIKSLLKQYVHDGKKQLADLKPILRQLQSVDPYLIYELETLYAAPEKVLNDYIDEICKQCKLNREHDLPQHTLSRLKLIITQTHSLITIMSQPQGAELNALVCQEQVQAVKLQQLLQQSQTTQNILKIGNNIRFANEVYSLATDGLDNVFSSNSDYRQLSLELRNLSGNFTIPYLKIRHVHFHPYAHIKQSNALLFYKPIQVLLIAVIDNTKLDIVGCTATGIQFFEAQIKKIPPNHPHSYMLIGTEGHVLSASSNCTPDLKEKIVRNESVRDAVLFIALLNGRVNNVEDLVCFIKKYQWSAQDFDAFVNTVQTLHLSRSPVDLTNIPKLAQRCGWENQPESSPLAPEQTTARTAGVTLEQCTAPQRTPSQRCSALRFNIPPQSVLASCLFAKKANAFAQLTLPENTSQSNNKNQ